MQALTEPVEQQIEADRIEQTYKVVFWGPDVPGGEPVTRFVYVTITGGMTPEQIAAALTAAVQQRANELVAGEARLEAAADDVAARREARRRRARVDRVLDAGSLREIGGGR